MQGAATMVAGLSPVLNVEQLMHLTGSNSIRPNQTCYTSSVRLRFIRRTNDETNYCRTVDGLI